MTFFTSIRGRLLLSLMAGILSVVVLTSFLSAYRLERMIIENRGELLSQLSSGMAYQLSKDMRNRGTEIQMLTKLSDIQDPNISLSQKRVILEKMRAAYPYYAWIGMTDADGNIITGTQGLLVGKNVSKRSWFIEGSKKLHLGSVHDAFLLAKIMPKPKWDDLPLRLVDVSAPIKDKNGRFLGVICGHLGWDWAFEMRDKMLASPNLANIDLLVAKPDGALLMGTARLPSHSINLLSYPFFQQALMHQSGRGLETWSDHQTYLTASSYISSPENEMLKWVVIAREKKSLVLAPLAEQIKVLVGIAVVALLLLFFIVYRLVYSATEALEELTKSANAIYAGNTQAKIPLYTKQDEVGILSRSLKKLVDFLQQEVKVKTAYAQELLLMGRVYEDSLQAVMITDADNKVLKVNRAFSELTGYTEEEMLGKTPKVLKSGRQDTQFYKKMWQSIHEQRHWQGEIWNKNKAGEVFPEWLLISCLTDKQDKVTHHIAIFSDITEKKQAESQLVFLANHDVLTHLPNRRLLQDHVNLFLSESGNKRAGLIFLDLDFFKSINDSLGHFVGDQLLVAISKKLRDLFQSPKLVARFGGDEFVIFVPEVVSRNDVIEVAEKIVAMLASPFQVGDYSLQVAATMGISLYPDDGLNAEDLLQAADAAMYDIKRNHNCFYQFFSSEMKEAAYAKLLIEADLKKALANNEFYVVYQPQIDLDTRKLAGIEVLLRWSHPSRGQVSPSFFVPVLEEMGLIDEVGAWVLSQSLRDYQKWVADFDLKDILLSINLSAIQLRNPNIASLLQKEVRNANVPCDHLVFEVTESVMLDDDLRIQQEFDKLKASGCHFALDDYGTGYSNLAYIDRFNLSELKVDQAFVRKMMESESGQLIVHHTIEMAKALGMKVVVEGVETEAQLRFLSRYSDLTIQGFYFAKPMTARDLDQKLQAGRHKHWLPESE